MSSVPGAHFRLSRIALGKTIWPLVETLDFADALHLAGAAHCDAFATFDRRLVKAATRVGAIPVRAP